MHPPEPPPLVCVNSTLAGRDLLAPGARLPSFHHWGHEPRACDVVLTHRLTRLGIRTRQALGFDPWVLAGAWRACAHGVRHLYIVTQPDLLRALPLLAQRFRGLRAVTWVWVPEEVERWRAGLSRCRHVFALTQGALEALARLPRPPAASLECLGSDPAEYAPRGPATHDVAIVGLANRDGAVARAALGRGGFTAVATAATRAWLGDAPATTFVEAPTHAAAQAVLGSARAAWIPTHRGDIYPTGFTNLVDALLTGLPTVVSAASTIPRAALDLPGVHPYTPGDADDLVRATRAALADPVGEAAIRVAAARVLSHERLAASVRAAFSA